MRPTTIDYILALSRITIAYGNFPGMFTGAEYTGNIEREGCAEVCSLRLLLIYIAVIYCDLYLYSSALTVIGSTRQKQKKTNLTT